MEKSGKGKASEYIPFAVRYSLKERIEKFEKQRQEYLLPYLGSPTSYP